MTTDVDKSYNEFGENKEVYYMPITEKKKASNKKWDDANLKRLSVAVPLYMYQRMQEYIDNSKESMNSFIKRGIELALNSAVKDDVTAEASTPAPADEKM